MIISRGGTARLLKQSVSLPVIEIGTTVYDVLCTLQRANIHEGRVAIVGYSNITQDMGILRTLLPYQLDVFTIQSSSQAVTTLPIPAAGGICLGPVRYGHLHRRQGDGRQRFPYHPPAPKASAPRSTRLLFFCSRQPPAAQRKTSSCASSCTNAPARP